MRNFYIAGLAAVMALAFAGCEGVSAPYVMKMDRVDQNVSSGNRGYLKGTPPPAEDRSNLKRPFIAVDIDLPDATK